MLYHCCSEPHSGLGSECSCHLGGRPSRALRSPSLVIFHKGLIGHASRKFAHWPRISMKQMCPPTYSSSPGRLRTNMPLHGDNVLGWCYLLHLHDEHMSVITN